MGPEPPRGSVPPGLVVVCVSAPAPWFLGEGGSCGRGLGEILGLLVSRVGERGPGQRRAAVPLLASPTPPPDPDPAGWPSTRRRRGLVWLGLEERRGACALRPRPLRLTLGPGRAVGARGRSGRCLRRSWRESAPLPTPSQFFVLETVEAEGCPARRVALSAPSCLRRGCRVPGTQPAAGRSLPSRSWVSATGDYLPGSGPARRGRKPPELLVSQRLGASEGESDTARAPLPPELKARGRSRPEGGEGPQAVRPCSSCPATGLGRKPQGTWLRAFWERARKIAWLSRKPGYTGTERTEQTLRCPAPRGMHSGGPRKLP